MHEMLHEKDRNWTTELGGRQKNGTFLIKTENGIEEMNHILPSYDSINRAIGHLF